MVESEASDGAGKPTLRESSSTVNPRASRTLSDQSVHERADKEEENCDAHCTIADFDKCKNLTGDLHQELRDDRLRERDFVNIAPLQFGEQRTLFAHVAEGRPSLASKFL